MTTLSARNSDPKGEGRGGGGREAGRQAGGSLVQLFGAGGKPKRWCVALRMGGELREDTPCKYGIA